MNKPTPICNGLTFFPVPEFDRITAAFGAEEKAYFTKPLPDIPRQFDDMAASLFYNGGELPEFSPQVDREKATNAVRAWLRSWAPQHECKIATVGYALWLWTTMEPQP